MFNPIISLSTSANNIIKNQEISLELNVSKHIRDDGEDVILSPNEKIKLSYTISRDESVLDKTFSYSAGEVNLSPIIHADNNISTVYGIYNRVLDVTIIKPNTKLYKFIIKCNDNGVWIPTENIVINIDNIELVTYNDEGKPILSVPFGRLDTKQQTIQYNNNSTDNWLTPELIVNSDTKYSIGEISYGSDSRIFVQAYGKTDISNRVFVPAYKLNNISVPNIEHVTGSGTVLNPMVVKGEETTMSVLDTNNTIVSSGMVFLSNGQIVKTMLYESEPVDAYFNAEIISIKSLYKTDKDAYYKGKKFRAYQMWVAPNDISGFSEKPKAGHLYMLKDTKVYPYTVKEITESSVTRLLFEPEKWIDLGIYDESLGKNIIGKKRTFRVLLNNSTEEEIEFITDRDLGYIRVGEYFGHSQLATIEAIGNDFITYTINSEKSKDDITRYNLFLSPSGIMMGTAYAMEKDFPANDKIELSFVVTATGRNGNSSDKEFIITIVRGFNEHYVSAFIEPNADFERSWWKLISNPLFDKESLYRESDARYGLLQTPTVLLKENCGHAGYDFVSYDKMKTEIYNSIMTNQSYPQSIFRMVLGNYKVCSVLDSTGNLQYDVIYRELHPESTIVDLSVNYKSVTDYKREPIPEIMALRQKIVDAIGEDYVNILIDPDDAKNRLIEVPALSGVSDDMLDTVPRNMAHPFIESNIQSGYIPIIPVMYTTPGKADAIMNKLIFSGAHKFLLNHVITFTGIKFVYFEEHDGVYIPNEFTVTLPSIGGIL